MYLPIYVIYCMYMILTVCQGVSENGYNENKNVYSYM